MKIEEMHNCAESEGKIVCIAIDDLGNTSCVYCGRQVNYYQNNKEFQKIVEKINKENLK